MVFGIVYWAVWRIVLPKVFKYELVPTKAALKDGTVVTVVRRPINACAVCQAAELFSVRSSKGRSSNEVMLRSYTLTHGRPTSSRLEIR